MRREKNILQRNEEGKKYPAHQIARKKILYDQKSPPPPQELNGRPLNTIFQIAGDFLSAINHHIGFPLSTLIYYAIYINGPAGDILIVIVIVCVNKL